MEPNVRTISHSQIGTHAGLGTNSVLRNTYLLLSMTLLFSAATAGFAMATQAPMLNIWIVLIGYFGLLFVTHKLRNSAWGIAAVFALTGFMGYTLGPILNAYISHFANGAQLVAYAFGATGVSFVGLSAYAVVSRKDFSFMRGFLFVGILVAFIAGIANIWLGIPALALAVSSMFVFLMAGYILWQTSEILHGGETNYILATVGLYVAIYNMFTSLLHLFGVFGGDE